MYHVIYECIICGVMWVEEIDNPCDGVSSGVCPLCFRNNYTEMVHRRQKREESFDCFGKSEDYCDQLECSFRFACLKSHIEEWEEKVICEKNYAKLSKRKGSN